jgi:V/A-type H+-transporting ATPase subunit B
MTTPALVFRGLGRLRGPYAAVDGVPGAAFHEMVELAGTEGCARAGQVVAVYEHGVTIEVFGPTQGLTLDEVGVRFLGHPARVGVGPELLGRVLDSLGRPRDGMSPPLVVDERPIDGAPLNPVRRDCPRECLETGFSAIDGLNTLTLGQKLPIFSESGLPHDRIAAAILEQARAPGVTRFAVVFAGLGLPRETAAQYEAAFRRSGARAHSVMVLSLADESATERLMAPRTALTIAEYLAWDLGLHVLVILTDVTNYGEALREVASARGEVPSRKGYPGYLYSDLASLFERAGRIRGRPGSITQVPIVTLPAGDMTHPIPDLTGYVTEGQIVLDPRLHARGIYPPVAVLPSLSRLMSGGIGAGKTREDHRALAGLLYAGCAAAERARGLEAIVGADELTPRERQYLAFGEAFERRFVAQADGARRSVGETLDAGWRVASALPPEDLALVKPEIAAAFLGRSAEPTP